MGVIDMVKREVVTDSERVILSICDFFSKEYDRL